MTVLPPLRRQRTMRALIALATGALAGSGVQVVQGYQQGQRGTADRVELRVAADRASGPDERLRLTVPTRLDVTVLTAVDTERYVLELAGFAYSTEAGPASTPDSLRDALVTAINADTEEPVTAVAGAGAGVLELTPDAAGLLWGWRVAPTTLMSAAIGTSAPAEVVVGERVLTVSVQCFSRNRDDDVGAMAIADKLRAALQLPTLSSSGVSLLTLGTLSDLTAIAGATFESRAAFDVEVLVRSVHAVPITPITTVADPTIINL